MRRPSPCAQPCMRPFCVSGCNRPATLGVRPGSGWPIWIIAVPIMETLTLTKREQARFQVLNSLLAEHMNTDQAATLMGLSVRHTRRLLAAYRESGAAALAHGNRGRRPSNTTSDTLIARVVHLARTRYQGANHTHLSELLREREGMDIGRTTLRRILVGAGVGSPRRRRPPQHRVRRQRMPREGMLIQIDGSLPPVAWSRRSAVHTAVGR